MNKTQAKAAGKKLNKEIYSLFPSTVLTFFEIDVSDLVFNSAKVLNFEGQNPNSILRFHNNLKLGKQSLFWRGKEYFPAPIQAEGFDTSSKGTLPRPKIMITSSEEGIPQMTILKNFIRAYSEIIGAKVTRIRTFAKYLDEINFLGEDPPEGFDPDPNVEFPKDIYFIERKDNEDKMSISFELSSALDLEGISLPLRIVSASRCSHNYRGEGCCYEFAHRRNVQEHGSTADIYSMAILPVSAPPVANEKDELISEILGGVPLVDKGLWSRNQTYSKGDYVFLEKDGIKYYFVAKVNSVTIPPPNFDYWTSDSCSKNVSGCKLRFSNINTGLGMGVLPFGGFPSANKIQ